MFLFTIVCDFIIVVISIVVLYMHRDFFYCGFSRCIFLKNILITVCPQAMYDRLFSWIVKRINDQLEEKVPSASKSSVIGVLDIYGFEIFDNNR